MTDAQKEKYGSRKFLMCVLVHLASDVALSFGTIEGGQWTNLQITLITAYNVANAYTHNR